ncbi:MAG: flagellar hook-basal body complex protein FliE [Pseudomonadota bacterium]
MELNSTLASRLYASMQGALQAGASDPSQAQKPAADETFAKTAAGFIETLRTGENTAMAGMAGTADPHSVVAALASAELAVQTAVTVRDKVVEAYQEILRMPV